MNDRRAILVGSLAVLIAAGSAFAGPEDAAQAAATSWLSIVDRGDYPGSWSQASELVKRGVKQADWAQMVGQARAPLGPLASRTVKSRKFMQKAPTKSRVIGGRAYTWSGPGPYVVIEFQSKFQKKAAVETVVTMAGADGSWRVSGYSVQ